MSKQHEQLLEELRKFLVGWIDQGNRLVKQIDLEDETFIFTCNNGHETYTVRIDFGEALSIMLGQSKEPANVNQPGV